ncbi:DNA replication/repair protein RecF [Lactobacillus iners]|uniref:DNA replication/repair protein RecF n=1 Tax=Lactobacillus iners TaxID=147802 RepID=UPI0039A59C03
MYLEDLTLKDFRNFDRVKVNFDSHINIFIGKNAQGKTNLLESIYFLALTKSHRTSVDKELIKFNMKIAGIHGTLCKRNIRFDLKLLVSNKGKKAWINRLEQKKLSNYLGTMNAILFSPEDLSLIKGSPAFRRRFMDLEFGQINAEYLYFLTRYRQVLQQRNTYLKQISSKKASDPIFLNVLTDQLAGLAAEVVHKRVLYLDLLKENAKKAYAFISDQKEILDIEYKASFPEFDEKDSVEKIYKKILLSFEHVKVNEMRLGTTLVGPHRDDLQVFINKKSAQEYASQGQQRSIVLSIKLAEIDLMHQILNEYPILLLDDVMSELDNIRQKNLLNYINGKTQTFITTTDINSISQEMIKIPRIFRIVSGTVSEEK